MTVSAKQKIIWMAVLVILGLSALVCWASFRPEALKSVYDITVNVIHSDGTETTFQLSSPSGTLYDDHAELGLIECVERDDAPERLFVTAVDGETAYSSWGQYWRWDRNGAYSYCDIDEQTIEDNDVFDFYIYTYEE